MPWQTALSCSLFPFTDNAVTDSFILFFVPQYRQDHGRQLYLVLDSLVQTMPWQSFNFFFVPQYRQHCHGRQLYLVLGSPVQTRSWQTRPWHTAFILFLVPQYRHCHGRQLLFVLNFLWYRQCHGRQLYLVLDSLVQTMSWQTALSCSWFTVQTKQ